MARMSSCASCSSVQAEEGTYIWPLNFSPQPVIVNSRVLLYVSVSVLLCACCERIFCALLRTFGYSLLCRHRIVCLNGICGIQVWIGMSLRLQSRCSGGVRCRALCFKVLAKHLELLALYFFTYNLMHSIKSGGKKVGDVCQNRTWIIEMWWNVTLNYLEKHKATGTSTSCC